MPVNLPNFLQVEPRNYSALTPDLLSHAIEGYKAARMPKQIAQEEQQRELANRLTAAKIKSEERYDPLKSLTGIAAQVASLEALKKQVGENSPIYQRALNAFELGQAHTQETINSSEFYRKNIWRVYDPITKQFHAQQQGAQGRWPEGGPAYGTPEQANQAVKVYEKNRYNQTTPTFMQQQYEAANQIDETIKLIDPKKAFAYSGVRGRAELIKDRYEAQKNGNVSQKLKDYEDAETYLHNLREQIRSYLSASITKGMTEDLDYLVNPDNWLNHPEIAERKYKAVVKAYEKEKEVTERAIEHGNPRAPTPIFQVPNQNAATQFQTEGKQIGLNLTQSNAENATSEENIRKTAKEKKWPKSKLQAALKHYGYG